jgi:alkylation response protein AidB-like acyl-CoA dehydrogenase
MKLALTEDQAAFQAEIRAFLDRAWPQSEPFVGTKAQEKRWAAALLAEGWAAYTWPREFGGPGWTAVQRFLWERETSARGLPPRLGGMGMMMLAPVLMAYGRPDQQAEHLPGILCNEVEWCQGYSEPGAGSDLASLATTAVEDGPVYRLTGEKIWTSWAHIAHWMFALVRTRRETRRQDGITFLLIDMQSPGIRVDPIITLDGQHTINRVSFTDVAVPIANRVGEEGRGWQLAKALLTHERTSLTNVALSRRLAAGLLAIARERGDLALASKTAAAAAALEALEVSEWRTLSDHADPGPQASFLKLRGTEIVQDLTTLYLEAAGLHALPFLPDQAWPEPLSAPIGEAWAQRETLRYFTGRTASIAGGSDEVQRDIIAKRVLGL